jgi:hypothetical protein
MKPPIANTPLTSNTTRPLNDEEIKFYKSTLDHYKIRCGDEPCNRVLRAQMKMYEEIVNSGMIGTYEKSIV